MVKEIAYVWPPQQCFESKQISHFSSTNGKLETIATVLTFVFTVTLNSLLLYALIKTKNTKNFTSRFLIIIACGDLLMACSIIPLHLYNVYEGTLNSCQNLRLVEDLLYVLCGTTTASLTLGICIDRYLFIRYSFQYSRIIQEKTAIFNAYVIISFLLTSSIMVANVLHKVIFRFMIVIYVDLVAFSSLVINIYLVCYIRKKGKNIRHITRTPVRARYQRRALQTMMIITGFLVITYLPMICLFTFAIYWEYSNDKKKVEPIASVLVVSNWSRLAVFLNASLNALVYISRNEDIRKLYRKMFCAKLKKFGERGKK
uniref:G-protein coupled receptors family 1 profile domain-containing protein n=1 Tax=Clytia hemisphaerica TaxID=252671 RepID=A0A7M5V8A9_9CNID